MNVLIWVRRRRARHGLLAGRSGYRVTVVDGSRAPQAGGHAVDSSPGHWTSSKRWACSTGSRRRRTGTERTVVLREGARRPTTIDLAQADGGLADVTSRSCATISARSSTTPPATTSSTSSATTSPAIGSDGEVTFAHGRRGGSTGDRGRRAALGRARARVRAGVGVRDVDRRLRRRRLDPRTTSGCATRCAGSRASTGSSASTARGTCRCARALPLPHPRRAVLRPARRDAQRRLLRGAVRRPRKGGPAAARRDRPGVGVLLRLGHAAAPGALDARAGGARRRCRVLPGPGRRGQQQPRRRRRLHAGG